MTETAPAQGPQRLPRHRAVNLLLSLYEEPRYLEIGIAKGETFHNVNAALKVAVDPTFGFDHVEAQRTKPGTTYHEVTSDVYFGKYIEATETFDVIYLDGLHTFEQTLRDLNNALEHLEPRGLILIDDVRPHTYVASLPDYQNYSEVKQRLGIDDERWMGDVYKLVWFIDSFYQGLRYRTISNNHGQAVVWRESRPSVTERTVTEVGSLTFEEFMLQRDTLRLAPFGEIMKEVRAAVER